MKCKQVLRRIEAYFDGELPSGERAGMEEHLRSCPSCSRELQVLRSLSSLVRGVSTREVPHMRHFFALRATGAPHEGHVRSSPAATATGVTSETTLRFRRGEGSNSAPHMRHFLALRATGAPHEGHARSVRKAPTVRIALAAVCL